MSDQEKENLNPVMAKKGPGELLQVARIEQSISIDDIARQMNLNAKILHSIEDDDYTDIQSPIFIRGYLRTYARLVGLDEDLMIKLFGDVYQQTDPAIKSIGNTTPEISSNDIRVKWMTYAVVIGLVVLLSVWWVNKYRTDSLDNVANNLVETPSTNQFDESNGSINEEIPDEPKLEALVISDQESLEENNELDPIKDPAIEPINISEKEVLLLNTENSSTVPEDDISDALPIENNDNIKVVDIIEIKTVEETPIETKNLESLAPSIESNKKEYTKDISASSGSDVLELNIVADSWGAIKDASKFKLLQDLLKAGTTYRLMGEAPFNVFLGNGYGVEITLNGQSYDFSKHIKSSNNTARFELEK